MLESATSDGAWAPFRVNGLELRNRIVFGACVNNLGRNDAITADQVAFYRARAAGGVAAIITEGLSVHPTSRPNRTVPFAFNPDLIPGFRLLADVVHDSGAKVFGQLWHVGRNALWGTGSQAWAPSALPDPYSGTIPHQMDTSQIWEVIDGFAQSAANLAAAGFDGVEIHGAHGYLVNQFLSPWSNRRQDDWGGDAGGRARFLIEILDAVRTACGSEFVIGLKVSAHEGVPRGIDVPESARLLACVAQESPVDYVAVSQGNFSPSLERHVPDNHFDIALAAGLCRELRDLLPVKVPLMALGRIPGAEQAFALVASGIADLVALVRPLLVDPDLVTKSQRGEKPRPCVFCNECWDEIHRGRAVACPYAPELGRELSRPSPEVRVSPAPVHVVGAGPCGLEAARVARSSGFEVYIHEAASRCGGRLRLEALLPGRRELADAAEWLEDAALRAGCEVAVNDRIDEEKVRAWPADSIVIQALGAVPVVEPLEGCDSVVSLEEAITAPERLRSPVVVVDELDDEPVYSAAEYLASYGLDVRLMTRRTQFAGRRAYISQIGVYRRLDMLGVGLAVVRFPVRCEGGVLVSRHSFSGQERLEGEIGSVIRAGPYQAKAAVDARGRREITIGDAFAPRSIAAVIHEANGISVTLREMAGNLRAPRSAKGPSVVLGGTPARRSS